MSIQCNYEDCERQSRTQGYCSAHYQQYKKGQELRPIRPYTARGTQTKAEMRAKHNKNRYESNRPAIDQVFRELSEIYGGRTRHDLAIAYATQVYSWESLFEGSYVVQGDCYVWNKGLFNSNGYGQKAIYHPQVKGTLTSVLAHRLSYALAFGFEALPEGIHGPKSDSGVIDHSCRNKLCINPDHLRVLSAANNTKRRWVA